MAETQPQRFSVPQLKAHWDRKEAAALGDISSVLSISEMPPWNEICEQLDWESHLVDGGSFRAKNHGFFGVYRIIALASEGDVAEPATLSRVCGQDASGTLYIGQSMSLSTRLNQLLRSAGGRQRSHGAISMLRQISVLDFPPERLGIALLFTERDAAGVESDLIKAYIGTFGDAPPLNYRL